MCVLRDDKDRIIFETGNKAPLFLKTFLSFLFCRGIFFLYPLPLFSFLFNFANGFLFHSIEQIFWKIQFLHSFR